MKKLIDDAKAKAAEAKEKATIKAQEALVEATIGVAKRKASSMVEGLLEGVVGSAEESLAAAQVAAGDKTAPALPIEDETVEGPSEEEIAAEAEKEAERVAAEKAEKERLAAERTARAVEELARLKAEAGIATTRPAPEEDDQEETVTEPMLTLAPPPAPEPAPEPGPEPEPEWMRRRDPFEAAEAALRQAAEARGSDPDAVVPVPRTVAEAADPMAAARAALNRAAEARGRSGAPNAGAVSDPVAPRAPRSVDEVLAEAAAARAMAKKGSRAQAREDSARAELARLKRDGFGPRKSDSNDDGGDDKPPSKGPRKRQL